MAARSSVNLQQSSLREFCVIVIEVAKLSSLRGAELTGNERNKQIIALSVLSSCMFS